MNRLLVRLIVAALALSLVDGTLVLGVIFAPRAQDYEYLERSMAGGMGLAVQRIDEDPLGALPQVAALHRWPVQIMAAERVEPTARRRLRQGQTVIFSLDDGEHAGALLADGQVFVVGPFEEWPAPPLWEVLAALAVVALSWVVALALALRPTARAIASVQDGARRLESGEWSWRVQEHPDLRELGRAFNRMASGTELAVNRHRDLLHAVSHELRTPLARLEFAVRDLRRAQGEPAHVLAEGAVREEIEALDALVGELLAYSRLGAVQPDRRWIDAREVVLGRRQPSTNLAQVHGSGQAYVELTAFVGVVDNLLANALRHGSAPVDVRLQQRGEGLCLVVDDAGEGIAVADRQRAIEPFVQLAEGEGTGLGLALVARTVRAHGGTLELSRAPAGGLRVSTWWPGPS